MTCALQAVESGKISIYAASRLYKIPETTLQRYKNNNISMKKKLGRKFSLTKEQKEELNDRIKRLAGIGYPITKKILRLSVYKYCAEKSIDHQFSDVKEIASRQWAQKYLVLDPSITIRKAQNRNPARAQKLNRNVVQQHFERYKQVLLDNNLNGKPIPIWNMDENGCHLSLHKSQGVLALKGARRVHIVGNEHGENVTIVACGNAAGNFIPPMILFHGKRWKQEWIDDLPPGSVINMTEKGSMTQSTFIKWLENFAEYKNPGLSLLVFDGAKSHISIVETAEKLEIILYFLPSNTTHELQPMDKAVFRSFEQH